MIIHNQCPILGVAAFSGTGKTTLLRQLLPLLKQRDLRVALVKHAHHDFEVDQPGKDSFELRKAGAEQMLLASARRTVLMVDHERGRTPALEELLGHLDQEHLDLILVEGFKRAAIPKLELHRVDHAAESLWPNDPHVIAVATDTSTPLATSLPTLSLNDVPGIAEFILEFVARHLRQSQSR